MPGKKYRSIKHPRVYEELKRAGKSKRQAARISNAGPRAWAKGGRNSHRKRRR